MKILFVIDDNFDGDDEDSKMTSSVSSQVLKMLIKKLRFKFFLIIVFIY
jgi:hypothetical protein